jgi:hypothetical protein
MKVGWIVRDKRSGKKTRQLVDWIKCPTWLGGEVGLAKQLCRLTNDDRSVE